MDKDEPSWDLYRTFLAVVRDGSFSTAARRLGVAQPMRAPTAKVAMKCARML